MTNKLINILTNIVNDEDHAKTKLIELTDNKSYIGFDDFIRVYFDNDSCRYFEINSDDTEFFINNEKLIGLTHEEFEYYCRDQNIELNW